MDFEKMLAEMRKLQAQQKNSKEAFEENLQILSETYGYDKDWLRKHFEALKAKQRHQHRIRAAIFVGAGSTVGWAISSYQTQVWSLPRFAFCVGISLFIWFESLEKFFLDRLD